MQVREERKVEEKRKKKTGAFATPARRGRVDDLRRQTLMNVSGASASSRGQRAGSVASNKGPSVSTPLYLYVHKARYSRAYFRVI